MSQKTCNCCSKPFDIHLLLTCCVCQKTFNHTCVGITASETRIIKSKKSLSWTCVGCSHFGNDINSLKAVIAALQNEVKELKELKSVSNTVSLSNAQFEEIISEINDRQSRKHNLVIYGVPEQVHDLNKDQRLSAEKHNVKEILRYTSPSNAATLEEGVIEARRLGRFDPNSSRPRPIKCTLTNERLVHLAIQGAKNIKKSAQFMNISLSFDRTPKQIEFYQQIKSELDERKRNGENNIKIKYVNNMPRIVNLN